MDADLIKSELEKQAAEKYASGDYVLGVLDKFGQRITIIAELPRKIGDSLKPLVFKSGWMVYPGGKIQCTTPATSLSYKGE